MTVFAGVRYRFIVVASREFVESCSEIFMREAVLRKPARAVLEAAHQQDGLIVPLFAEGVGSFQNAACDL
jgi:hypothetical protein